MDAEIQLRAIADIVRVVDVEIWLRGGWAMDFFLGEVTRPHGDIDFFCRAPDAERVVGLLRGLGYQESAGPPPDLQRDLFGPGGLEVQVTLLGQDPDGCPTVPGGPHAGARWPANLLHGPVGRIGNVTCRIISPHAQIEIKKMMPIWAPGMPRRQKDAEDIARLQAALTPNPT